jgi:hypothetical protein
MTTTHRPFGANFLEDMPIASSESWGATTTAIQTTVHYPDGTTEPDGSGKTDHD